jgi:iron complex outermembrane receptor protein
VFRIQTGLIDVKRWCGVSVVAVWSACAQAAVPAYDFSIPAKPLPQALRDFSRVTGQGVIYTQDAPYAIDAPALIGSFSAEQALRLLLSRSALTFRRATDDTFTLQSPPAEGVVTLGATQIASTRSAVYSYQPPAVALVMLSTTPSLESPQAVSTVPAQALSDQAPRNLDDALANVSGVTQGNTLGSTQDTLMKRGFGDNRDGSIMRDGMPVVQGRNLNATAERVEVLKGPASLLYGIQDPGGVINVVSKRPQLPSANALTARGSSFGSGKNGSGVTLDSTGAIDGAEGASAGLAYRLIVDHEDEDYWRNYGVHRESLVAPSLAWYGDDTEVLASSILAPIIRWIYRPPAVWTSPSTTWKGARICIVSRSTTALTTPGKATSVTATTARPTTPVRCG